VRSANAICSVKLELETFRYSQHQDPADPATQSRWPRPARPARPGKGSWWASQAGSTLGIARAALFAGRAEVEYPSELSFFLKLREEITDRALTIVDGWVSIQDALAIRVDPDRLREMAVPRELIPTTTKKELDHDENQFSRCGQHSLCQKI
jgi:hypothetical protein